MTRKSNKASMIISLILTCLLFAALIFLTYWLPEVVTSMIDTEDHLGNRANITATGRALILADAYAMVAIAYIAVFLLCRVS